MKQPHRGFIALISAVIISTVLLTIAVSIGANTFFSRFDALNHEYKRLSLGFAESCVTTALGRIGANYNYSASNVLVSLGTLYGKPAECTLASVSAGTPVNGKKTFTIIAKANFNNAYSTISTQATAQDPEQAPVTPPPTCAFNPTAISVPGGQTVSFAWSTAGSGITSFVMDRGVGSLTPYSSGSDTFSASISPGTYTYTGTVANAGGTSNCNIIVTVTAPPPAPSCADTVMMLDRSYSMFGYPDYPSGYNQWIPNEKAAAKALVDLYAGVASSPKVGFGRIADLGTGHSADLVTQLTTNYSGIKSAIDGGLPSNPIGYTNLGEALRVGATELESARHTPGKEKVLIFVSDGIPNEPNASIPDDTTFLAPTANSANNALTGDQWTNPAAAYSAGSTTDSGAHRHRYSNFGFTIPSNASIQGITIAANARNAVASATTIFADSFGTGSSLNDIQGWEEEGTESDNSTLALTPGSGQDSASPDGGRFAKIGTDEWICRSANASGLSGLNLSFFWRGDADAESSDRMYVEYNASAANCDTTSGWTAVASDNLNGFTSGWSPRQTIALPASLNNDSSFFIRFRVDSNSGSEELRIDAPTLTSTPAVCNLGVDLSWNGGSSWTSEKTQTLTTTATDYTFGNPTDTWGRAWSIGDLSNGNFRARIRATAAGSTCSVDTLSARVSYTVPTTPSQYALDQAQNAKSDGVSIFSIHFGDTAGMNFMGQLASVSTLPAAGISTAARSGGTATITTSSAHRLTGNQRVQITGVSNAVFNGTFTVTSTPTPNTFTYALSGSAATATGGSAKQTNLFVSPSSGAMSGIFQSIGYQICPAAAPSCSNGGDDDGDALVDEHDGGCHSDGNAGNAASYDPNDNDEWTTPIIPTPPAPPPPPPAITIGSWVELP